VATQSQKGVGVPATQPSLNDVHFTNFHPQPQNPGNYENSNWNSRNHSHSRTTSGHPMKPEVTGNGEFDYNYSHLKQNQPIQEQSSVVMVYGVDPGKINCAKLFNILCLYGNVLKIKFLKSKPNTAMVQMCTPGAVDRACQWLNGIRLFGLELNLSKSKQLHLIDSNNSKFQLSDLSSSFQDYSNSRNHRFASQKMAKMNRQQKPNRTLHYFNAPPAFCEEDVESLCMSHNVEPTSIKVFQPRDQPHKISSGLIEFKSIEDAIIFLTEVNHKQLDAHSESSKTLKLCFSSRQ
jgi:heterogeneous nuclear ribonucleoprotein L